MLKKWQFETFRGLYLSWTSGDVARERERDHSSIECPATAAASSSSFWTHWGCYFGHLMDGWRCVRNIVSVIFYPLCSLCGFGTSCLDKSGNIMSPSSNTHTHKDPSSSAMKTVAYNVIALMTWTLVILSLDWNVFVFCFCLVLNLWISGSAAISRK